MTYASAYVHPKNCVHKILLLETPRKPTVVTAFCRYCDLCVAYPARCPCGAEQTRKPIGEGMTVVICSAACKRDYLEVRIDVRERAA